MLSTSHVSSSRLYTSPTLMVVSVSATTSVVMSTVCLAVVSVVPPVMSRQLMRSVPFTVSHEKM